jgi:hypothetical protein
MRKWVILIGFILTLSAIESVCVCIVRLDDLLPKSFDAEKNLFRTLIIIVMKYYVQFMQFLGFLALFVHQSKNFIANGGTIAFSDIMLEHTRSADKADDSWEIQEQTKNRGQRAAEIAQMERLLNKKTAQEVHAKI